MRTSEDLIQSGPLQDIFSPRLGFQYSKSDLQDLMQRLSDLDKVVKSYDLDPDPYVQRALTSALESLVSCVADISKRPHHGTPHHGTFPTETKIMFVWPSEVSRAFLGLVKASHPLAVLIIAHYCCLIRWSEPAYWFCQGWGPPLAACITSILGDSELMYLTEWPVKVMNEDK